MNEENIKHILKQGEGYNIEFKRSINKDLPKEICSFVNASGGKIFIGINDNNTVCGVNMNNKSASSLQNYINSVNPTPDVEISEFEYKDKNIVVLDCPSGKQKPYMALGSIYIRQGANAQKLISPNEIRVFFQEQSKVYFDLATEKSFNFPEDLNLNAFEKFKNETGIRSGNSAETVLRNLRLLSDDMQLRNAGILLFAKSPQRYFPHATIRFLVFKGTDKRYILDDKRIEGTLTQQFFEAMNQLRRILQVRYDIENTGDAQRHETPEIPLEVLREALINALVHRDYEESGGTIQVEVFDNRIEISNPGGLIAGIPQKQFGKRSLSRNPLIFGIFMRLRLAEQVGSGILRMQETMRDAKLPAPDFQTEGIFSVSLYRPVDFEQWLMNVKKNITKNQGRILKAIYANPEITHKELAEELNLSTTAVGNNIKKLKHNQLLERIGSDKTGYWTVKTQSGV